jgi:hypothetical protein
MVKNLLTEESLIKFLKNAKKIILEANIRIQVVPQDYNEEVVRRAYDTFETRIQPLTPVGSTDPLDRAESMMHLSKRGKLLVYDGMDAFFSILDDHKLAEGLSFGDMFSKPESKAKLQPFLSVRIAFQLQKLGLLFHWYLIIMFVCSNIRKF